MVRSNTYNILQHQPKNPLIIQQCLSSGVLSVYMVINHSTSPLVVLQFISASGVNWDIITAPELRLAADCLDDNRVVSWLAVTPVVYPPRFRNVIVELVKNKIPKDYPTVLTGVCVCVLPTVTLHHIIQGDHRKERWWYWFYSVEVWNMGGCFCCSDFVSKHTKLLAWTVRSVGNKALSYLNHKLQRSTFLLLLFYS